MLRTCSLAVASLLTAAGSAAQGDLVRIQGGFDCGNEVAPGQFEYYQLRGQSVYFSNRTASLTTGGQLDGVDCRNDDLGQFEISFYEFFPEVNLTDYLTYGYFGIVDTVTGFDTDGDGFADFEQVTDTSFVMAVADSVGEGSRVEDFFPTLDEATLVEALTTSFDSPEFFEALAGAVDHPDLRGDIGLIEVNAGNGSEIRPAQQLTLIAFKDGANGDEGRAIGYMTTDIQRIPERLCADQNDDGIVSSADFTAWIANFNSGDLRADTNGDHVVSPADFTAWIAAFNQGENGPTCLP